MTKDEKQLFLAADINKDGNLNKEEFRSFYSPEDYPHMQPVILLSIMNRFDIDKDGKITFEEFIGDRSKIIQINIVNFFFLILQEFLYKNSNKKKNNFNIF